MAGFLARCYADPQGTDIHMVNGSLIVRCRWGNNIWYVEETQDSSEWELIATCQREHDAIGTMFNRMHRLCS